MSAGRFSVRCRLLASVMVGCFPTSTFASDETVTVGQTSGQIAFSGSDVVTIQAGGTVSTTNQGAVILTGDSTGAVVNNAGTIQVSGAFGGIAIPAPNVRSGPITVNNTGVIRSPDGVGVFFGGATGPVTINNSGSIAGAAAGYAIVTGSGDDTLNLSTNSALTGAVWLGAGVDSVNLAGGTNSRTASQAFGDVFGAESVNVNTGYWTLSGELETADLAIAGGATLEIDNAEISSPNGILTVVNDGMILLRTTDQRLDTSADDVRLSGSGRLELTGGGVMQLGSGFTMTGLTTVTDGRLIVTGDAAGSFNVGAQGVLRLGANYSTPDIDGFVNLLPGGGATGAVGGDIANAGSVIFDRSNDVTYSGAISGTGSVTKLNGGVLTLSGANTYTGGTTVSGGGLKLTGSVVGLTTLAAGTSLDLDPTGSARFIIADGATVTNSGTIETPLVTTGSASTINFGNSGNTLNNSGTIRSYNGNAVAFGSGADTLNLSTGSAITGVIRMGGGTDTVNLAGSSGVKTATQRVGDISGSELLNVNSGYWTLQGEIDAYAVTIASGSTLEIDNGEVSSPNGILTVANDGMILLRTTDQRLDTSADDVLLSGSGRLELAGGGIMHLDPSFTMTGLTTVTDGRLIVTGDAAGSFNVGAQGVLRLGANFSTPDMDGFVDILSGGGATGTVGGDIANAGSVIFDRSNDLTYSGAISGTGSVTKLNGGVLTLSGVNTYTGTTVIAAGTLALTGAGSLASSHVLNSGVLDISGTTSGASIAGLSGPGMVDLGARTLTLAHADGAFSGVIGGSGALRLNGGTQVLGGANTFTGGTVVTGGTLIVSGSLASGATVDPGGTLQIGTGGTAGSVAGPVVANGTVIFNHSSDHLFSGAFSGTGSLIKRGAGRLTLDGLYSFSGNTTIEAGAIKISQLNATGSLVVGPDSTVDLSGASQSVGGLAGDSGSTVNIEGSSLTVNQTDPSTTTFSGALTGNGSLIKDGPGTLELSGVNTYTGPTTIDGGTLRVNGSISSPVTVADGGTLGGSGIINGDVTVAGGGNVNPGNSPGTLNVVGDFILAAGSNYTVEATAAGVSDRIVATGDVTIAADTTVAVTPTDAIAAYGRQTSYTIISANSVTGTFTNVTSSLALLTPHLTYTANQVNLSLTRNDVSFASLATTGNQGRVAAAIEAGGIGSPLYSAVVVQDAAGARTAYDALSGEAHSSLVTTLLENEAGRSAMIERLGDTGEGWTVWGGGHGASRKHEAAPGTAAVESESQGVLFGVDQRFGGWRAGLAFGLSSGDDEVKGRGSRAEVSGRELAAYAGSGPGPVTIRLGASHGRYAVDTGRAVAFTGFTGAAKGSYDASVSQAFADVGLAVGEVEPFASVAWRRITRDAFTEQGGAEALILPEERRDAVFYRLGVRGGADLGSFRFQASAAWRGVSGDRQGQTSAAFAGTGQSFLVSGAAIDKSVAEFNLSLAGALAENVRASIDYAGEFGDGSSSNTVGARLAIGF